MESDLEQQYENPQLGKRDDYRVVRVKPSKEGLSEYHARDELTDHSGLTDALSENAEKLREQENRDENGEQVLEGVFRHRGKKFTQQTYFAGSYVGKFFRLAPAPIPQRTMSRTSAKNGNN